ncbi:TPA: thiol:disulfide interchange protein DsbA/DsbL [Citrobacter koseri]|nr:thiol:disulfide interchange protein DsbA/DsbL [Citrobacter koseri]
MRMYLFNKLARIIIIMFSFFICTAHAFTEGVDYIKLEKEIPHAQNSLVKVFSYDCPFCYKYDKSVTPAVMEQLGDTIPFIPFHLSTKGKYGVTASRLFSVLIYKDQLEGISLLDDSSQFKKAKFSYYTAYHDYKERWNGGAEDFLNTGLEASGINKEYFDKNIDNPDVQAMLSRWNEYAYDIAKIQGVPAFVVNGKYLILTKSIRSVESMADLVKTLAKK